MNEAHIAHAQRRAWKLNLLHPADEAPGHVDVARHTRCRIPNVDNVKDVDKRFLCLRVHTAVRLAAGGRQVYTPRDDRMGCIGSQVGRAGQANSEG